MEAPPGGTPGPSWPGPSARANHSSTRSRIISLASSGKRRRPPGSEGQNSRALQTSWRMRFLIFLMPPPEAKWVRGGGRGCLCLLSVTKVPSTHGTIRGHLIVCRACRRIAERRKPGSIGIAATRRGPFPACHRCHSLSDRRAGLGLKEGPYSAHTEGLCLVWPCSALQAHGLGQSCTPTAAGPGEARGRSSEGQMTRPRSHGLLTSQQGLRASFCLLVQFSLLLSACHCLARFTPSQLHTQHTSFSDAGSSAEDGPFLSWSCITNQAFNKSGRT